MQSICSYVPSDSCQPARTCQRGRRGDARRGFTLLELLLVLSILVVIGGIVMMNLGNAQTQANVDATKAQMNSLKNSIQMYQIRLNKVPETLETLRDGPKDSSKQSEWTGAIIDEIPNDAWGNPFVYSVNGNSYELRSGGIDGQVNTEDDIVIEGS